jgi:hypothetical protein
LYAAAAVELVTISAANGPAGRFAASANFCIFITVIVKATESHQHAVIHADLFSMSARDPCHLQHQDLELGDNAPEASRVT